jgi:hypothetical protein
MALPAWADGQQHEAAPTAPPRSYETRSIEAPPEPPGAVAQALGARGARRLRAMTFHQAPIAEVLRALASEGAFNLVIAEGVPDSRITIELKDVPLRDALQAVLAAGQLEAEAIGSNIVLVRAAGRK